jgi:hypothetical protein
MTSAAYDPAAVPQWARETIALIAREQPERLAFHLDHVAEIEAAGRHRAEQPPPPPTKPRDLLHLAAIQAWQALASGQDAPHLDPAALEQAIYDTFVTSDGRRLVDELCDDWLEAARQRGIPAHDEHGDPLPEVDDAITRTVTAAIWFGITTGYLTLTGSYRIPHKFAGYAW